MTDRGWMAAGELTAGGHRVWIQSDPGAFASDPRLPFDVPAEFKGANGRSYRHALPSIWTRELGLVLGWLIGEGDEVPPVLAALRQLLDDPTFGPQPLTDYLLQHDGQVISEALALLPSYAPVTVWQDALVQGARGDHGTLIEAGICGHIFPPGETVVLVFTGSEGTALNLEALSVLEAVKRVQTAGPRLSCVITRDLGPYWDRALFHLQPF